MKAYSLDLRERIVRARAAGQSEQDVAQRFGVCGRTVRRYWQRHHNGCLSPGTAPGQARRLSPDQEPPFLAMVAEKVDWALQEMAQEWEKRSGVWLPRSTLHDSAQRLGLRYKKRVVSPRSVAR